jgi:hypothetical protein
MIPITAILLCVFALAVIGGWIVTRIMDRRVNTIRWRDDWEKTELQRYMEKFHDR